MSSTESKANSSAGADGRQFPSTHESLIQRLVSPDPEQAREALSRLCELYRDPIFFWLRRRGNCQESAEDLAQSFVQYLLEKNRFGNYVRGRCKFRSFLLECLRRFVHDEWRRETAAKRGGGQPPVPLEEQDLAAEMEIDKLLDQEYALALHRRVMARLQDKYAALGQAERFLELRRFTLGDDADMTYAEVAQRLGLVPTGGVNCVKKAVFDLRERYLDLLREEVAEATPAQMLDEELRYVITLLATGSVSGAT